MSKGQKPGALYAIGTIDHDCVRYAPGDQLPAMSPESEAALRAAGVVSAVPPVEDEAKAPEA